MRPASPQHPGRGAGTSRAAWNPATGSNFAGSGHLAAHADIVPVTGSSGTSIKGEHPARTGNRRLNGRSPGTMKNALIDATRPRTPVGCPMLGPRMGVIRWTWGCLECAPKNSDRGFGHRGGSAQAADDRPYVADFSAADVHLRHGIRRCLGAGADFR